MKRLRTITVTPKCKATDLGLLQEQAENAARALKGANTALVNAQQAVEKAENAYNIAQKALTAGTEQVRIATKV